MSGSDIAELKVVRNAIRKCIKTARLLFHEREYFRFIKPNLSMQEQSEDIEVESVKDRAGSLYPNEQSHYSVNN